VLVTIEETLRKNWLGHAAHVAAGRNPALELRSRSFGKIDVQRHSRTTGLVVPSVPGMGMNKSENKERKETEKK
jgi:hypothetical protein